MSAVDHVEPGDRMTRHICRYCRHKYLAPAGSRPHACPDCAPTFEAAIRQVELEESGQAEPAPVDDEIPF